MSETRNNYFFEDPKAIRVDDPEYGEQNDFQGQPEPVTDTVHTQTDEPAIDNDLRHSSTLKQQTGGPAEPVHDGIPDGATVDAQGIIRL